MDPILLILVNQYTLILLYLKGIHLNYSQTNLDTNNLDPEVYEVWLCKIKFKRQLNYERHYHGHDSLVLLGPIETDLGP